MVANIDQLNASSAINRSVTSQINAPQESPI